MDKKVVITQVMQGIYPSDWLVYRGSDDYAFCIIFSVFAFLTLLFTFYIFILSVFNGYTIVIDYLIFMGLPYGIFVTAALLLYRRAKAINHSNLVILPDGVLQCYAGDFEHIGWLSFPCIKRLDFAYQTELRGIDGSIFTNTCYWLDVYGSNGTYFRWWTKACFGDTTYLNKSIIAKYNHYWQR